MGRVVVGLAVAAALVAAVAVATGHSFAVREVWFARQGEGYAVRADLHVGRQALIKRILHGGYQAELNFELRFMQRREWFFDNVVGNISWRARLSYDTLTRRYILDSEGRRRRFAEWDELVASINRLRAGGNSDAEYLRIVRRDDVYLRARFYLDTDNLPEPVQIGILIEEELDDGGDWVTFPLEVREQ